MGLLSDLIQTGARSRSGYLKGRKEGEAEQYERDVLAQKMARDQENDLFSRYNTRRQAEQDRLNSEATRRHLDRQAEQDRLNSEATRRHLDRLSSLRDPNDEDVLRLKHQQEMELEGQRNLSDEIRDLGSIVRSSRAATAPIERTLGAARSRLQKDTPPQIALPGTPELREWQQRHDAAAQDTIPLRQQIDQLRGEERQALGRMREIRGLPPLQEVQAPKPTSFKAGGREFPIAARQELSRLSQQFLRTVRELEADGDRVGTKEAQRIYRQRMDEILARHGAR